MSHPIFPDMSHPISPIYHRDLFLQMGAQQQWRHYGYSKAAKTLRGLTWEVTDVSQANLTLSKSHSPKYFANLSSPFCVNVCVTRVVTRESSPAPFLFPI